MRRHRFVLLLLVVCFVVLLPLIHIWMRYRIIRVCIANNEVRHRIEIKPTTKQLPLFSDPKTRISLGYAQLDLGIVGPVIIHSHGDGTWLSLTNETVQIAFVPPFPYDSHSTESSALDEVNLQGNTSKFQSIKASWVDAQYTVECTTLEPVWRWLTMSNDRFALYSINLLGKLSYGHWGHRQIFFFNTPHLKGLTRVGCVPDDSHNAFVTVASRDDQQNVAFEFRLAPKARLTMDDALKPVLSSFQFTGTALTNKAEIAAVIRAAGISNVSHRTSSSIQSEAQ